MNHCRTRPAPVRSSGAVECTRDAVDTSAVEWEDQREDTEEESDWGGQLCYWPIEWCSELNGPY